MFMLVVSFKVDFIELYVKHKIVLHIFFAKTESLCWPMLLPVLYKSKIVCFLVNIKF